MPVLDEDMGLIIIPLSAENLPRELINESLVAINLAFKASYPNLEISIYNIFFTNYTFSKNSAVRSFELFYTFKRLCKCESY